MTKEQIEARIEAWDECAEHLGMIWTSDPEEKRQGVIVQKQIRKRINYLVDKLLAQKKQIDRKASV